MIEVINRELLIPREEFNIGTNYDDASEVRTFHLKRVTAGGIDLANLSFSLDMLYANDEKDSADLDIEVTEKDINLTLTVVNSMLQVPGSVIVQLRALTDDGAVKWTSYPGAFFVEDAINTPASYTGDLTVLERLETEWNAVKAAELARVTAETARQAAEEVREEAEQDRETAETARAEAEEERVEADGRREQEFADAIATAQRTLNKDFEEALDDAKEELTDSVTDIKNEAAGYANDSELSAHDAAESAAAAKLSEQNAAASEHLCEDAIATARRTLNADYQEALDDAKEELTDSVTDIKDEAAESAAAAALSAHDAAESAAAAKLSEQNAAASEHILDFYVDYVIPRFIIANNRIYVNDTSTQEFLVMNNRLYIKNPA